MVPPVAVIKVAASKSLTLLSFVYNQPFVESAKTKTTEALFVSIKLLLAVP